MKNIKLMKQIKLQKNKILYNDDIIIYKYNAVN